MEVHPEGRYNESKREGLRLLQSHRGCRVVSKMQQKWEKKKKGESKQWDRRLKLSNPNVKRHIKTWDCMHFSWCVCDGQACGNTMTPFKHTKNCESQIPLMAPTFTCAHTHTHANTHTHTVLECQWLATCKQITQSGRDFTNQSMSHLDHHLDWQNSRIKENFKMRKKSIYG